MFLSRTHLRSVPMTALLLAGASWSAPVYGREALHDLRPYGMAVRVACTGALEQDQETFAAHIQKRLEARSVQIVPEGSVTLKLFVTSIQSSDGFFVVQMRMELDQAAFLGSSNKLVDAPTWDAWKMGEYREEDLLSEVDDLTRQFLNDYIASN